MDRISNIIVKFRKQIIMVTAIATVLIGLCFFGVKINYDMTDYLPKGANSTVALNIMQDEFDTALPSIQVMVPDVDIQEALDFKAHFNEIDDVTSVTWLDDMADLTVPLETLDQAIVEGYYVEGDALFQIAVKDGSEAKVIKAIEQIGGDGIELAGTGVEQAQAQRVAVTDTLKAIAVLVPLILLILFLTTTSWIEPLFYIAAIAAAILINLGSELIRGEISFVTLAVAPILQLAVSIDYAVFLANSFNRIRLTIDDNVLAMKMSLKESFSAIAASAATTFFGFAALMFMEFGIGADMGISLVKGIVLSFVSIMVFLPAMMLSGYKLIDKTVHRGFLPSFDKVAAGIMRVKVPCLLLLLVLAMPFYIAQQNNDFSYGFGGLRSSEATQTIDAEFEKNNPAVLLVPTGDTARELALCEAFADDPRITSVTSYVTSVSNTIPSQYLSQDITKNFYSEHYARIILTTNTAYEGAEAFTLVEDIRNTAAQYYEPGSFYLCGESVNLYDTKQIIQQDNARVNLITLATIYLVLLITFRSVLVPFLLIFIIKAAIWINMAVPYFMGTSMNYVGYLVISTVQMGATIDYAIFLTEHYMQRRKREQRLPAMKGALSESLRSILVSALILSVAGFCLTGLSQNALVQDLGALMGRGALISFTAVALALPALLLIFDRLIPYTTWKSGFYKGDASTDTAARDADVPKTSPAYISAAGCEATHAL